MPLYIMTSTYTQICGCCGTMFPDHATSASHYGKCRFGSVSLPPSGARQLRIPKQVVYLCIQQKYQHHIAWLTQTLSRRIFVSTRLISITVKYILSKGQQSRVFFLVFFSSLFKCYIQIQAHCHTRKWFPKQEQSCFEVKSRLLHQHSRVTK